MVDLSEKVALVTGAGSGMGRAIAHGLAQAGARVVGVGRTQSKLQETVALYHERAEQGGELVAHTLDVADRDAVASFVEQVRQRFGPIGVLVNNAGVNIPNRRMDAIEPANWDHVLNVNLTGPFNLMHAVLPMMRAQKDGLIVNIASVAGIRALPLAGAAYAASKYGLTALSSVVTQEEKDRGIRCTAIHPGEVNTPILDQRPEPVSDERKAAMVQPEDIAAAVLFVALLPPRAHVPELILKPVVQDLP